MRITIRGFLATGLLSFGLIGTAAAADGEALLVENCAGCHSVEGSKQLTRIDAQRKTPEGWTMTLFRMDVVHDVKLSNADRRALVKHLSDTRGMAPSETADFRYILERTPNVVESATNESISGMCTRCHSLARAGLQGRTEEEWLLLAHQHLGQWPTTEYQAGGRDREWFKLAVELAPTLAREYPFETAAWTEWAAREKKSMAGTWRIAGSAPNRGVFTGHMLVDETGADTYSVETAIDYADGTKEIGTGGAIVYTGFEWRARVNVEGVSMSQVFAASEDGDAMAGRMFRTTADELGFHVTAVREADGVSEVLAVSPTHLRAGSSAEITISGTGLSGDVSLGEGVGIEAVLSAAPNRIKVKATAAEDTQAGPRAVRVGSTESEVSLTVYEKVDSVRIEPPFAIARVGGGSTPRVQATFEAVAYANGADGQPGTDDDVRIGAMPAVWSVKAFDEVAQAMEDAKFAGAMDARSGIFTPAMAGPNAARPFSTNNAGNLSVVAVVNDDGQTLTGEGQLVVTVQRWNDPPIR